MGTIKSIGILTSGGDAPGMNAAIRAVTRSAIYNGLKVYGIYRGYKGLVTDEIQEFKSQNVSNIIQMGGTNSENRPLQRIHDTRRTGTSLRKYEKSTRLMLWSLSAVTVR